MIHKLHNKTIFSNNKYDMLDFGEEKMKKKIVSILICTLLIAAAVVIIPNEPNVKAVSGGGNEEDIGLDFDFVWNVTMDYADVVHVAYDKGDIRKGRLFGTKGEHYAANKTEYWMKYNCSLDDVEKIELGHIPGKLLWYYTSKVEVVDYKLTINNESYPYPNTVPYNESAATPSGLKDRIDKPLPNFWSMNYNRSFENMSLVLLDLSDLPEVSGGLAACDYKNVSCTIATEFELVLGNVSYINFSETVPVYQEGMVYLIDEVEGCNDKLDNITNATAVILIDPQTEYAANLTNRSCQIARALANNPSIILGDEPTGDLDSESARSLMSLIQQLRKQRNQTFIIVTHDPIVVEECTKIYSIRDGQIELQDHT